VNDDGSAAIESDQVFDSAAELFRLLSTPIRLKIISALCQAEKNATQIYYRIGDQRAATLCRAVCMQIVLDADEGDAGYSSPEVPKP
jgi:DNA-binding transcriptional ArsR family regulator